MIILSKKRLVFVTSAICLSLLMFMLKDSLYKTETLETVNLPVSNKVIVIDARTSEFQMNGAESSNGTTEAETNLKIALKVQSLLEQSGATVILTRSDENAIYDIDSKTLKQKKISDIHNRVKIGNESSADIFVSIHLNKIPQQQYSGWQTFYQEGNEKSINLAKSIQANLNDSIQKENKRVAMKINNIYIMKHVEIPTTIVECGFLSNPDEAMRLTTDDYQRKLVKQITESVMEYIGLVNQG